MIKLLGTFIVFVGLLERLGYMTASALFAALGVVFAVSCLMDLLLDYASPQ